MSIKKCFALPMIMGCFLISMITGGCAQSEDTAYQKGAVYLKQNRLDEAISELNKAIELNPASDKAYYDRARAYRAKGNLDQALADYTQAININSPETIQSAYNNRGQIYEIKGDLDKALEDYTKGIEAMPDPKFSGFRYFKQVLYRNRVKVYLEKKEYDKALDDVQSIEKMGGRVDPEFIAKLKNRDFSLGKKSETDKPVEKYPGASGEVNLYNDRGYNSFKNGRFNEAIADYNRAFAIDPKDTLVLANRANAYVAQGKFIEAIADFKRVLEIDPEDYKVSCDLGLTYVNVGDYDNALYYFNKALEINPTVENDGQFHNDRGVAYFFLKDYDKCWEDVNKATQLGYPVHPQFLKELKKATGRER